MLRCTYLGFSHNLLGPLCFLFRTVTRKDTEHEGKGQKDRPVIHKPSRSHITTIYRKPIKVHNKHFTTSSVTLEADEAEEADDPLVYTPPPSPLPPPYSPPHHQRSPGQVTGLSGSDFLSQWHVYRLNGYKKRCPCKFRMRKRNL